MARGDTHLPMVQMASQTLCRCRRRIDSEGHAKPRSIERCGGSRNEVGTVAPIGSCDCRGPAYRSCSETCPECPANSRRSTARCTFAGRDNDSSSEPTQEAGQTSFDLPWQCKTEDRR